MPHSTSMEAKNISAPLRARLDDVGALHNGKIPLHGRLLAQWLHYAFPQECPYPHKVGTVSPQTPARWEEVAGEAAATAGEEEVQHHLTSAAALLAPSPEAGSGMWNLDEVVLDA